MTSRLLVVLLAWVPAAAAPLAIPAPGPRSGPAARLSAAAPPLVAAPLAASPAPVFGTSDERAAAIQRLDELLAGARARFTQSRLDPAVSAFRYVKITGEGPAESGELELVDYDGNRRVLRTHMPAIGHLLGGQAGGPDARVGFSGIAGTALVPRSRLAALGDSRGNGAARALRPLTSGSLAFAPGEPVRLRDEATGRVRDGRFLEHADLGKRGKKYSVEDESGARVLLPRRLVYRKPGEAPARTPDFLVDTRRFSWAAFEPRRGGMTELFLDAAARFTSEPGFLTLADRHRLMFLTDFVRAVLRPDSAAAHAEFFGLRTFDGVISAGIGVCRHLATLLAAALSEAGYKADVALYAPRDGKDGHAWVEVAGRDGKAIVVDPMLELVTPLERAEHSFSPHAAWYVSPEREHVPTKP